MSRAPGADWPVLGNFSWDFGQGEIERMIEGFTAAGLRAVQLAGGLLDEALDDPARARAMGARLAESDIAVAGLGGYRNIVSPDPERRRANLAYMTRCLEIAPLLGTTIVATETGTLNRESDWLPSPANESPEARALLRAALDELLPAAEASGAVLALEGYVNNVVRTPEQMASLLDRYPTPHLGVVLDPFNYLARPLLPEQDCVVRAFLEAFETRFVIAHLKDVGAGGAEEDTPELGTGVFTYGPYMEFLRTRRPDLPLILEHLPWSHVPAAIRRLRALLPPS